VVINKVDKPNCRPDEVHDAVFELFFNLDATEEQLNFLLFMVVVKMVGSTIV
jgi:GTP-binding protein